jgi:hypothetical protein
MNIPTWLWFAGAYLFLRSKGEEGPDVIPPKPAKAPSAAPNAAAWNPPAGFVAKALPDGTPGFQGPAGNFVHSDGTPYIAPYVPGAVHGDAWVATGTALVLQPDTRYFARLALSGLESAGATAGAIKEKFKSVGFRDVYVWMDKVPVNLPDGARGKSGPFVMGTWNGAAQTANLPHQVAEVWMES